MYASNDPRAALAPATKAKAPSASFGQPAYGRYYEEAPESADALHKTWLTRGQNFLVMYVDAKPGHVISRENQPDEYMLLLSDKGAVASISWDGVETEVVGPSVTFIPAGESSIAVQSQCRLTCFFTTRSQDLVGRCGNAAAHIEDGNVPEITPWPDPVGGFRVRSYDLGYPIPPGGFGRLFRSTTFMINAFDPRTGPRDPKTLSPHDHDDFQQCSLVLEGTYVHHLRWPWGVDRTKWQDDAHETIGSPSVTFIPARVMHTSEASGPGTNLLIDIFCPPRFDFSAKPGWVMNAEDYPQPSEDSRSA